MTEHLTTDDIHRIAREIAAEEQAATGDTSTTASQPAQTDSNAEEARSQ